MRIVGSQITAPMRSEILALVKAQLHQSGPAPLYHRRNVSFPFPVGPVICYVYCKRADLKEIKSFRRNAFICTRV